MCMGLADTLVNMLAASTESPQRGDEGTLVGSFWCHDCNERIPVSDERPDDAPRCPNCDAAMEFERSPSTTGCAC